MMRIVMGVAVILFTTQFAIAGGGPRVVHREHTKKHHSCRAYGKLKKCHAYWDRSAHHCKCRQ